MTNFSIRFTVSGYLLLLLLPAFAVTLFLYFRMEKRYRKTKNRILSMILHTTVLTLCICVLSGMYFSWEAADPSNELVLLIDASFSEQGAKSSVDGLVHDILSANDGRSKIAVVTFGYDQKIALEMDDHDPERAFSDYLSSPLPDTSATDICSALTFVWDPDYDKSGGETGKAVIDSPENARILLVSDGVQTDRDAMSVIRRISMDGIHVDTTFFPGTGASDMRITDVSRPDKSLSLGEKFEFTLTINSNFEGNADLTFTDRCENEQERVFRQENVPIKLGLQTVALPHSFSAAGHHEIEFRLFAAGDGIAENNVFYAYCDLSEENKILLVEKYADESKDLAEILLAAQGQSDLVLDRVRIGDGDWLPVSLEAMQNYDEIVLVNVSHADMPEGFEENLQKYVETRGGGLFTVGGFERDENGNVLYVQGAEGGAVPKPHAYDEADLQDTLYQQMLPVDAVSYTPPVALAIIIDRSNSMDYEADVGGSILDLAIRGAIKGLDALSTRDFVGVMTLEDSYAVKLDMTPMTQKSRIVTAIRRIADGDGGGTNYGAAIEHAGRTLGAMTSVERKHILLISDSQPGDAFGDWEGGEGYGTIMKRYHDNFGITLTVISIGHELSEDLLELAKIGDGSAQELMGSEVLTLDEILKADIFMEQLSGAVVTDFHPTVRSHTDVLDGVNQRSLEAITLHGFFGSRAKASDDVQLVLNATYAPLYAQWNYGNGKVGSFLCDLEGFWSQEFTENEAGAQFLQNVVKGLMPIQSIRSQTLDARFIEDNYRTQVSVYGFDPKEEPDKKLIAFVEPPRSAVGSSPSAVQKFDLLSLSLSGNRFTFENRAAGVHTVTILKVPRSFDVMRSGIQTAEDVPQGEILSYCKSYRVFSYSEEYDPQPDSYAAGKELLIALSSRDDAAGEGKLIYDAEELLGVFVKRRQEWNPQILFISISIVLFLLDIAVRKFKFKWPHEWLESRKHRKAILRK